MINPLAGQNIISSYQLRRLSKQTPLSVYDPDRQLVVLNDIDIYDV
jgi:hypothetical protein